MQSMYLFVLLCRHSKSLFSISFSSDYALSFKSVFFLYPHNSVPLHYVPYTSTLPVPSSSFTTITFSVSSAFLSFTQTSILFHLLSSLYLPPHLRYSTFYPNISPGIPPPFLLLLLFTPSPGSPPYLRISSSNTSAVLRPTLLRS